MLLETPLARLFGAGRTPVRQALLTLEAEGLLSRFAGRGKVAGDGGAPIRRVALDPAWLGAIELPRRWGWQEIFGQVERELTLHCLLGEYQVNESELANQFAIGRTVAHDALVRIEGTGLIRKDDRARWLTVPLDDRRVSDLFELRRMLEPVAMAGAAGQVPKAAIAGMLARLDAAADAYPQVDAAALDRLEHDLHVDVAACTRNIELPAVLTRIRCIIISSRHLLGSIVALPASDPFIEEHRSVMRAIGRGQGDRAAHAMLAHLNVAQVKVTERLRAFRTRAVLPAVSWLRPVQLLAGRQVA